MINQAKTFILLAMLTALLLFAGNILGGRIGFIFALVFVVLMNIVSYFFSHKFVLAMYKAKPAEKTHPELIKSVREVAHLANIPMPKVYIIPSPQANAFATGRNPKNAVVAVTEGIMQLLSKDELKGVIAHEVAHIKNRDILIQTVAATLAGIISYLATMAKWSAIFGGFGDRDSRGGGNLIAILALAIITPIIAMLIQFAISRSREYLADETGAKILHNPYGLANALEKLENSAKHQPLGMGSNATAHMFISNPFRGRGFIKMLSTHPPTSERVKRLKEMSV